MSRVETFSVPGLILDIKLFLTAQHPFHPTITTPWCFLEPPLQFAYMWFRQSDPVLSFIGGCLIKSSKFISLTIVIGWGMFMWLKLVQWYSTLGILLNCGEGETLHWGALVWEDEKQIEQGLPCWMSQSENETRAEEAEPKVGETWVLMTTLVPPGSNRAWS